MVKMSRALVLLERCRFISSGLGTLWFVLHNAKYPFTIGVGIVTQPALYCRFKTTICNFTGFRPVHPIIALTPATSGAEPSVDFMSSTVQFGGQRTLRMNRILSWKLSCPQFLRVYRYSESIDCVSKTKEADARTLLFPDEIVVSPLFAIINAPFPISSCSRFQIPIVATTHHTGRTNIRVYSSTNLGKAA